MSSPTRRTRWVLAIPLTVLALGSAAAWWLVTPSAFSEPGGGALTGITDTERGATYVLGYGERPSADVTMSSARPLIEGEAEARVRVCDRPLAAETGSVEEVCGEVAEVAGTELGPALDRWLVVEVTPAGDGGVQLRGLAVSYTQGIRFGRQVTGGLISLDPPS